MYIFRPIYNDEAKLAQFQQSAEYDFSWVLLYLRVSPIVQILTRF